MQKITREYTVDNGAFDFDSSVPCIIGTTVGFMTSKEFRSYMEYGLELIREKMEEYNKLGWLADTSKAETFVPADTDWCINTWNPAASKAGIKYCAFVVPESVFSQLSVEEYSDQTKDSGMIVVNHFKDIESAKDWLREVLNN